MKKVLLTIFLLLLLIFTGCARGEKSREAGIRAYQDGKYQEAVDYFRLAISQGDTSAQVKADLAVAYVMNEDPAAGELYMNKALEQDPGDLRVLKKAGMYYEALEDTDKALEFYKKSLKNPEGTPSGDDLDTVGLMADMLYRNNRFSEAVSCYNELISANYYRVDHEILAGECYLSMNQVSAACQYFDMTENEKTATAEAYLRIFEDFSLAGNTEEAARYFEKGLAFCGKENQISKGVYLARAGRTKEALKELEQSVRFEDLLAYGQCCFDLGDYETAEKIYSGLLKKGEHLPKVYNAFMILKMAQGDGDSVRYLLTEIENGDDESAKADGLWNEIVFYEQLQDYETAYQKLKSYQRRFPVDAKVRREYQFLSRRYQRAE